MGILNWGKKQQQHSDEGMEAWRQQQPGESRKEYLARYQREYHRHQWYPDHKKQRIQQTIDRRDNLKQWLKEYKRTLCCERCGYNKNPNALQFHHRDPGTKRFGISSLDTMVRNGVSLETLQAEIAKCDILCANCHAEVEAEKRENYRQNPKARRGGW